MNHSRSSRPACPAPGAARDRAPSSTVDSLPTTLRQGSPSVSVVIPAMNEAKNLPHLARRMPPGVAEIVLVDGRSTDDTVATARALWPNVEVVRQTRTGKGNALACGLAAAQGDIIVTIDADGSMDASEIPIFVEALLDGADYAKGSRFIAGGGSSDITRIRKLGNRALNGLTGRIHKTTYTDLCYGFNAMWRYVLPVLGLDAGASEAGWDRHWGDGFEVETLMNIRVHLAGLSIAEVPSFEAPRVYGSSNLRAVGDGWRVLTTIAREHESLRRGARLQQDVLSAVLRYRFEPVLDYRTAVRRSASAGTHEQQTDPAFGSGASSTSPASADVIDLRDRTRPTWSRYVDATAHSGS